MDHRMLMASSWWEKGGWVDNTNGRVRRKYGHEGRGVCLSERAFLDCLLFYSIQTEKNKKKSTRSLATIRSHPLVMLFKMEVCYSITLCEHKTHIILSLMHLLPPPLNHLRPRSPPPFVFLFFSFTPLPWPQITPSLKNNIMQLVVNTWASFSYIFFCQFSHWYQEEPPDRTWVFHEKIMPRKCSCPHSA